MEAPLITGVAHDQSQAKITVVGVPDKVGTAADIFTAVAEAGINVDMIVQNVSASATGRTDISFTLPASDAQAAVAAGSLLVICATPITGPTSLSESPAPWTSQLHMLLYAACAAFFVAPVAVAAPGHAMLDGLLGNAAMRWLGKVSYGVFLWQLLVIQTWFDLTGRLHNGSLLTDLPVLAAASVLAGAACFHLVERPAQRLWNRWADATSDRRDGAGRVRPSPDRAATAPSPAEPR